MTLIFSNDPSNNGGGGGSTDTYTKAEINALLAQKQDVLILNNPFSFTLDQSRGRIAGFTESDGVLTPQGIATAPTFSYDSSDPLHAYYTVGNAVNNLGSSYILMPFYNHYIYRLPKGRSGWLSGGYFEGSVFVPVVVFFAGLPDNFTSGGTTKWNNLWYFGGTYTASGSAVSNSSSSLMFDNEAAVAEDTTSDFSSLVKSFNFQIDVYDNTTYDAALQYWSYLNDSEWVGSTTVSRYDSSRHSQLERMTHILYVPSINDSFSKDVLAIYAQTERLSWGIDDFIVFMSDNPTNVYNPSTDESVALTIKLDPSALVIDTNGRLTLAN